MQKKFSKILFVQKCSARRAEYLLEKDHTPILHILENILKSLSKIADIAVRGFRGV